MLTKLRRRWHDWRTHAAWLAERNATLRVIEAALKRAHLEQAERLRVLRERNEAQAATLAEFERALTDLGARKPRRP